MERRAYRGYKEALEDLVQSRLPEPHEGERCRSTVTYPRYHGSVWIERPRFCLLSTRPIRLYYNTR